MRLGDLKSELQQTTSRLMVLESDLAFERGTTASLYAQLERMQSAQQMQDSAKYDKLLSSEELKALKWSLQPPFIVEYLIALERALENKYPEVALLIYESDAKWG